MNLWPETFASIASIAVASILIRMVVGIVFKIVILVAMLVVLYFIFQYSNGGEFAPGILKDGKEMLTSFTN